MGKKKPDLDWYDAHFHGTAPPPVELRELPPEVTQANLYLYSDASLAGRLTHYTREWTFERNLSLRSQFKVELERTRIEINRRKMYERAEAERIFAL